MQPRIKPHHIVVALGVAIALFTALSGVVAGITGFHSDSPITREVFGNVPAPLKAAFCTVIPVLLVYGSVLFANRVKNWERGRPDNRRTTPGNVHHRMADFRAGVYMPLHYALGPDMLPTEPKHPLERALDPAAAPPR